MLLLSTNIEKEVSSKICGNVARIGGSVNQIINYKNCKIVDINIIDGGFGHIKRWQDIKSARNILETAKRQIKQKALHLRYGEKICRDWKTIIMDLHEAYQHEEWMPEFDAVISSNVLEHSPNPIFLLLNFYFITKKGGYQFHAIPHCKYTYDMFRKPTPIEHMVEDFERKTQTDDLTHNEDYIRSAIIKHGYMKKFHETHPVAYPFMHFHVFDENNVRELFQMMFEEVTNDIIKTETVSDNVVIFKNVLNKDFVNKYRKTILGYSENFLK